MTHFYNFDAKAVTKDISVSARYIPGKYITLFLEGALKQRNIIRSKNNDATAELLMQFGDIVFTTEACGTVSQLLKKYQSGKELSAQIEQEKKDLFLRKNPQHQDIIDCLDELNTVKMDKAIQQSSVDNVLPLVEWFREMTVLCDTIKETHPEVNTVLNPKPDAERLEAKLQKKGFPSFEEWMTQTARDVNNQPIRLKDLTPTQSLGLSVVADIQLLSRSETLITHSFWDIANVYENELKAQPRMIQDGKNPFYPTPSQRQNY